MYFRLLLFVFIVNVWESLEWKKFLISCLNIFLLCIFVLFGRKIIKLDEMVFRILVFVEILLFILKFKINIDWILLFEKFIFGYVSLLVIINIGILFLSIVWMWWIVCGILWLNFLNFWIIIVYVIFFLMLFVIIFFVWRK